MVDVKNTSDVELLRQVALVQDAEIRRLHGKLADLTKKLLVAQGGGDVGMIQQELARLEKELSEARAKLYRDGSERRPRAERERDRAESKAQQTGHGPTPQPQLALKEVVHELDEADKTCPSCGGALAKWEGQFDDSEEVDVVDIQYVLKKHRRQKYRCGCGSCIETAIGPEKLIKGGRYSLGFAIHVAIQKYSSHLPLERQAKIMARAGLDVETQTLWDQLFALSRCFTVAIERLHKHLLSKDVLMADETRWPLLGVKGRATKNWFDWVLVGDDAVLHSIFDTRSNDAADKLLSDYRGIVVSDGYAAYDSRGKVHGFTVARDWVHARRYFIEAEDTAPDVTKPMLDDIGKLFLIEREIAETFEGRPLDVALKIRHDMRQARSKALVAEIGRRAMEVRALSDSPIARAVKYLQNQWAGLIRFLDDPRIPITTNLAEGALRNLVLGRNNHFGSKSERGTQVAAMFYSLIESATLNGLDPAKYLRFGALAHLRGESVPLPHEVRELADLRAIAAPAPAALSPSS